MCNILESKCLGGGGGGVFFSDGNTLQNPFEMLISHFIRSNNITEGNELWISISFDERTELSPMVLSISDYHSETAEK